MFNVMNVYEFMSILLLVPVIIYVLKFLEKVWYKSSVSPNMQTLYRAKAYYENVGKIDGTTIRLVLSCDLYYHYIWKDRELLKFINKVLVKVGRRPIEDFEKRKKDSSITEFDKYRALKDAGLLSKWIVKDE